VSADDYVRSVRAGRQAYAVLQHAMRGDYEAVQEVLSDFDPHARRVLITVLTETVNDLAGSENLEDYYGTMSLEYARQEARAIGRNSGQE
jgi:hypothetical protein